MFHLIEFVIDIVCSSRVRAYAYTSGMQTDEWLCQVLRVELQYLSLTGSQKLQRYRRNTLSKKTITMF